MTTSSPMPAIGDFQLIERKKIHPHPTNRKHVTPAKMKEMVESMRVRAAAGLVVNQKPVILRPHPTKKGEFELCDGERRWRGGDEVDAEYLAAEIRELTDEQLINERLLANDQNEETHPLDEALQYQLLIKEHGYDVQKIADRHQKTLAVVYGRLKLLALTPANQKLFLADKFNASVALYLARIPNAKLQDQAGKEVTDPRRDGPMSARDAQRFIQQHYMLRLVDAPFDIEDEALLPKAGSCAKCPKRTGNQGELFADVEHKDMCTDPICFEEKREAVWIRRCAAADAEGNKVLSATATKKVFPHEHATTPAYGSGYVDLASPCYDDEKRRTHKQLLKPKMPPIVLARDPSGGIHELIEDKNLKQALKDAGHDFTKRREPTTTSGKKKSAKEIEAEKKQREQMAKEKAARATRERAWKEIAAGLVAGVEKKPPDKGFWRGLIDNLDDVHWDAYDILCERRDVEGLDALPLDKMSEGQLRGIVFEYAILGNLRHDYINGYAGGVGDAKELKRLCELYKVDLKAIEKEASTAPAPKEEKAAAAESPKPAAKAQAKKAKKKAA